VDIRVPLVGLGPLMRLGTSVVFIAAAVLPEGSAVAQFAPSGGAGLHAEESSEPPEPSVTEPPADAEEEEEEEVKHDIAGFDKANLNGFFVQSRDAEFRLNLGAYTQFRYNLSWLETPPAGEDDFNAGFLFARTRIFFEGHLTKAIEYQFRLNIDDTGNFALLVAYAGYNFKDYRHQSRHNHGAWNLRVGRQFIAITREDWMFPQDLLTTEYSAVDQVSAVGAADGLQAFVGKDRGRAWLAVSNGAGGSKDDFPNIVASQVLLSARGEVQLLGDDWSVFNDLVGRRGRAFGILLGVGSGYQISGPNAPPGDPKHSGQVTVDLSVGGNGFQALAYGTWSWAAVGTLQSTWGFVAQGGYFIFDPWQVYARYELVDPGNIPDLITFHALTLGTNLFPLTWTNRIKLSVEGGLLFSAVNQTLVSPNGIIGWLPADEGNQYYLRFQLQFGF